MTLLLAGVAGSGKTAVGRRLASSLGWAFVDADDLHPASNIAKMAGGEPLGEADRGPWLDAVALEIAKASSEGRSLVVACSALKRCHREQLLGAAPGVVVVMLRVDPKTLHERLRLREDHFFRVGLLESQFAALEEPTPDEAGVVVVDVADGVAATADRVREAVGV